jgi:hypothetical protein
VKVGDIVIIINFSSLWNGSIMEIIKAIPNSFRRKCRMLKPASSKKRSYPAGSFAGEWPEKHLRLATIKEISGLNLPISPTPDPDPAPDTTTDITPAPEENKTCTCPSEKLFNSGCNCGGN